MVKWRGCGALLDEDEVVCRPGDLTTALPALADSEATQRFSMMLFPGDLVSFSQLVDGGFDAKAGVQHCQRCDRGNLR